MASDEDQRLRSEAVTSPERRARITENRRKTVADRKALLASYRERLMAGLTIDGSVSQQWLIDAASSAALDVEQLTKLFVGGRATANDRERLLLARGQLQRLLRDLGITPAEDPVADATSLERLAGESNPSPEAPSWADEPVVESEPAPPPTPTPAPAPAAAPDPTERPGPHLLRPRR